MKLIDKLIKAFKETPKSTLIVYLTLRLLVIVSLIRQIFLGEWDNALLCILSLFLFTIPTFLERKLKIDLPNLLECVILCFIFSAEILGEINNFYLRIPHWDTILHTLNGFLAAGVGFSLFDLLNKNSKKINLSPLFLSIVAFSFSMTIGVLWEIFEYTTDNTITLDMQKDEIIYKISSVTLNEEQNNKTKIIDKIKYTEIYNVDNEGNIVKTYIDGYLDIGLNDTMHDLIVNFIGASCFSIFGFLYIINRDKYKFIEHFVVKKN